MRSWASFFLRTGILWCSPTSQLQVGGDNTLPCCPHAKLTGRTFVGSPPLIRFSSIGLLQSSSVFPSSRKCYIWSQKHTIKDSNGWSWLPSSPPRFIWGTILQIISSLGFDWKHLSPDLSRKGSSIQIWKWGTLHWSLGSNQTVIDYSKRIAWYGTLLWIIWTTSLLFTLLIISLLWPNVVVPSWLH